MTQPLSLRFSVQFLVEPDDDGFHAFSPALPGLHTDGETEDDAARAFADAVPAYVESILKHGEPLPIGVVVEPAAHAHTHVEDIIVPWLPPSLLTSGDNSRA